MPKTTKMEHTNAATFILIFIIGYNLVLGDYISVDLAHVNPENKLNNTYKGYYNIQHENSEIYLRNLQPDVGFYVIQIHSHKCNLIFSSVNTYSVNGTNIGVVDVVNDNRVPRYFLYKDYSQPVTIMLAVTVYTNKDPIPGCKPSFNMEYYSPVLSKENKEETIVISFQPATYIGSSKGCNLDQTSVELYHMFLREYDFSSGVYFDGISLMLDEKSIRENSRLVAPLQGSLKYRRIFSSYRGTGEVFVVIIERDNRTAIYVPTVSYGCDLSDPESCSGPVIEHWKFVCAFFVILGLFVCFFGHKFFRTSIFLGGFASGIFITYIFLLLSFDISPKENATASLVCGLIFAIVWLFLWCGCGKPLVSIFINLCLAGFTIASVIFYFSGLADKKIFHNDVYFWVTFWSIVICVISVLTIFACYGHIISCSILGSYAFIFGLNYYIGGNLQYIILNTYRRIAVDDFNFAVIDPPFELYDGSLIGLWIILFVLGCIHQFKQQMNKAPFPPSALRSNQSFIFDERTPLLDDFQDPLYPGRSLTPNMFSPGRNRRTSVLGAAWKVLPTAPATSRYSPPPEYR